MPVVRLLVLALFAPIALLPLPAAAASLESCAADLDKYPPAQEAEAYAARLKNEKLPREAAFWSHYCVGRAWKTAGEFKKALPALQAAARLAQSANERNSVQSSLGSVLIHMNRLDEAETAYKAALAAAEEMGAAIDQAAEISNLGGIASRRKQYDQALAFYTKSLTLQPDEREKSIVLNNMATVHSKKGDHALAVDVYRQAIAIERKFGDQKKLALSLLNLGNTYRELRQWKECTAALTEGLQLARTNGDRYREATGLKFWGWAYQDDNQPVKAKENLNAALNIFREIGAAAEVAEVEADLRKLK